MLGFNKSAGCAAWLSVALLLVMFSSSIRCEHDEYQSEVLSDTEVSGGSGNGHGDKEERYNKGGDLMESFHSGLKGMLGGQGHAHIGLGDKKHDDKVEDRKEVVKGEEKKDIFDFFKVGIFADWLKLIFNPFELVKSIAGHFKIPFEKLIGKIGHALVLGLEPLLYPLVFSIRIIEKIFVPDQCRLKFMCTMGVYLEFMREHVLKFSPNFLEGSAHLKALSEGIVGKSCSASFPDCEPKLKKPYEELSSSKY